MFTGIITNIGKVEERVEEGECAGFSISTLWKGNMPAIGASISCSGVCLTVISASLHNEKLTFKAQASAETLRLTTTGDWRSGTAINLESALKVGDELGGHMVSGHVDGLAEIMEIKDTSVFLLKAPLELSRYIARKGSVTLDGVSLTVNSVNGGIFSVNIIPHTMTHTTFQFKKPGDMLNLEVDTVARYLERIIAG